jgi:hypothetical protein
MEICISGVTAVFGATHMRWFHHQFELGGNSSTLHSWVGWFNRKLPVNFVTKHHIYHTYAELYVLNLNLIFISQNKTTE